MLRFTLDQNAKDAAHGRVPQNLKNQGFENTPMWQLLTGHFYSE